MTCWYMKQQGSNFDKFCSEGWLVQDEMISVYICTDDGWEEAVRTGWVCRVEDYMNDRIKKHELTRKDKEADRKGTCKGNKCKHGTCIFTYRAVPEIDE
jgi:uncharacterized protein (DUF1015 family)